MVTESEIFQSKILIVDDEPANVRLLERTLEDNGFKNLIKTTDPRDVKSLYQEHRPDLILLDLLMPHLNGFEVMSHLKEVEHESYLPVLILTAQSDNETQLKALNSGAKDFLGKPFNISEILCRINNMLEVRILHNQVRNHNKILEEKVKERTYALTEANKMLHHSRKEVIERLGRAAEYRDNETGLHVIRMSHFCAILGHGAGMSDSDCEILKLTSPMHDIGKIGIPDSVLLKPGKLDAEEWKTMKTHASIGGEILSNSKENLMGMAEIIAVSHHEKWDGSGYPNGLKGEKIPLAGRITAISDVFDALTSVRPYKKAWTVEKAVELIESERGKHFDPSLVDSFLRGLPNILDIKEKFAEEETSLDLNIA